MSTPTISSLGIGSGIDSESIITKLMALERRPLNALATKATSYNAKISAYGALKSRLSDFQAAAQALTTQSSLQSFTTTFGDKQFATAAVKSNAAPGTYQMQVLQLASGDRKASNLVTSTNSYGSGSINITLGGNTSSIAITGGSLSDVAGQINAANVGVTAKTIDEGNNKFRLVLESTKTGAAQSFTLSVTSADNNLAGLATTDSSWSWNQTAQNAQVKLGQEIKTSATNTIDFGYPGVSITAQAVGSTSLKIDNDQASTQAKVKTFIDAYNAVQSQIKSSSAYDSATKTASALNGESGLRSISNRLRATFSSVPAELSGNQFSTLSAIGIQFDRNGVMSLDNQKFNNAMSTNAVDVSKAMNAYASKAQTLSTSFLDSSGPIENRISGIKSSISKLDTDRDRLTIQVNHTEKRMRAQFVAMEALVTRLKSTSEYVTQQFDTLRAK